MTNEQRYIGTIASAPKGEGYAFIGITGVNKEDGAPHGLETEADIFLHRDDCSCDLVVGRELSFTVSPDRKRGENKFRAFGAVEFVEVEVLPPEQPIAGFEVAVQEQKGGALVKRERLPVHVHMKEVPEEIVDKVLENEPMAGIPRDSGTPRTEEEKHRLASFILSMLFPNMANFGADYKVLDYSDEQLDNLEQETVQGYEELGLGDEVEVLKEEIARFKSMRDVMTLFVEEDLVRRDTIIPIKYLPDIFMAVPVWYYWTTMEENEHIHATWENDDPSTMEKVRYFCDFFKNQVWMDTFQLFNRRVRSLKMYKGEVIPPQVVRRMRKAVKAFDYVVIATPYHDEAGKDWQNIEWLRSIDPYVIGFKKGVPFFFVIARFTDAGTFPLYDELVADTIDFLKKNVTKLDGFNNISKPYWACADGRAHMQLPRFGDYLMNHVKNLLNKFDAGELFDWLREGSPEGLVKAS